MILYTFLINAALVTLASLLITPIYLAKFTNGEWLDLRLHRGDHRRLQPGRGRIVGGLLLGVIDTSRAGTSSQYRMGYR